MDRNKARKQIVIIAIWMMLIIIAAASAAFAWFSFNKSTNVEPMASTVGEGGMNLLISNSKNGTFGNSCKLIINKDLKTLSPVSTSSLKKFYRVTLQDGNGISILYKDDTSNIKAKAVHGYLYLKSEGNCDVYLNKARMSVGKDIQMLSAGRLAMTVSTKAGTSTHIFSLDSMANTSSAKSRRTVPKADTVVASVDASGNPQYVSDPAQSITSYYAGGTEKNPAAGKKRFCQLKAGEVAQIEYYLYLEGCDENCFNEVQNKDITLQFGFAAVQKAGN